MAKYDGGMALVALAISDDNWKDLCKGELEDQESRNLFGLVQRDTMSKAAELEGQAGMKAKSKAKPTICSLGIRFRALEKKWKDDDKSFEINSFMTRKLGGDWKSQHKICSMFSKK